MQSLPNLRNALEAQIQSKRRVLASLIGMLLYAVMAATSQAAPANDNFANAAVLTMYNDTVSVNSSNVDATKEAGEPNHAGNTGGKSLWWKWTATSDGALSLTTVNSTLDTVLGVYTGSSVSNLTGVASNDNANSGATYSEATFNVTAGTTYYIAVDGVNGAADAIRLTATFLQPSVPTISYQSSSSVTVYAGQSVSLYVSVNAVPSPSLRWQRLPAGASAWVDLVSSATYSGTTSGTLTITNVTMAMNGDQLRCLATNVAGSAASIATALTVYPAVAPAFVSAPSAVTVEYGELLNFSLTVTGTSPITFEWKKDGVVFQNSNGNSIYKYNAVASDAGTYVVTATNSAGSATSSPITVTVNPAIPPAVYNMPATVTVPYGNSLSFGPSITGSQPRTYQWKKDGVNIPSATSSSLYVSPATTADNGVYTVTVTNDAGTATSSSATVTVDAAIAPAIYSLPSTLTVDYGSSFSLSPVIAGSQPRTYQWTKDGTTVSGATDSSFYVYSATTTNSGSYVLKVTNAAGTATSVAVAVTVNPAVAPVVTNLPAGIAVSYGNSLNLSPSVSGTQPISYQWKKDGTAISNATSSYFSKSGATTADSGNYTLVATNLAGTTTSAAVAVTVSDAVAPTIPNAPTTVAVAYGNSLSLSLNAYGSSPMTFQWKKDGINIPGGTSSYYSKGTATTADSGVYTLVATNAAGSATSAAITVTVAAPVAPVISNLPANLTIPYGESISLYPTVNGSQPITYQWTKDDSLVIGAPYYSYSKSSVTAVDAGVYRLVATNAAGTTTSSPLTVTVNPPIAPVITNLPPTLTIAYNTSLNLSPTISGTSPMTYQWKKDGVDIPGATSSSYGKSSATNSEAGVYTLVATNVAGSTTSSAVTVTVSVPVAPSISNLPPALILGYGDSLSLSPTIGGTSPMTYQWKKNGVNISSSTSSSYYKSSVTSADAGVYTLTATNSVGSTTSSSVTVTVNPAVAPSISGLSSSVVISYGNSINFYPSTSGTQPITYQWKKDGANLPSATSAYYSKYSVTPADSGAYTLTATNVAGTTISSTVNVTVTPAVPPVITGLPSSLTLGSGEVLNLYPYVGGTSPMTYQWKKNGVTLPDQTYSSLSINSVTTADSAVYSLTATNVAGTATTTVTVTVNPPVAPAIFGLPATRSVSYGSSLSLSPTITGSQPMTYQWKKDGVDIPDAVSSSFYKNSATTADNGVYTLTATNVAGTATSSTVTVTVDAAIAPVIYNLPASRTLNYGDSFELYPTVGGTYPITYVWKKDGVALANGTYSSYYKNSWMPADSGVYTLTATNAGGTTVSAPVNITVNAAVLPSITQQPLSVVVAAGSPASFNVTATGTNPISYQWYFNGTLLFNATGSTLTLPPVQAANAGNYTVVLTNPAGTVTSDVAVLSVKAQTGVVAVAAGSSYSLIIKSDGTLWATGNNSTGQLGDGTRLNRSFPVQIATGVATAAAGNSHSLFVKTDGTLWAVGSNDYGQLGNGSFTSRSTPVQIASGVVTASAGVYHSAFVKSDGTLWTMGSNASGQLGGGAIGTRYTPIQVATNVMTVAAGGYATLFIKSDGTLWITNSYGGGGSTTPTQISTDVASVTAGGNFALFIKSNGTLWGVGYNDNGQLGTGGTAAAISPIQITTGVVSAFAGTSHSLFIKTDGTLWGMGSNSWGQLAGTSYTQLTPLQITTGVATAAAGATHTLFVKSDGSLWGLGSNNSGELGSSVSYGGSYTPVQTAGGPTTTPAAPAALTASNGSVIGAVKLSWGPAVGASYYEIWRNTTNDFNTATRIAARVTANLYYDWTATPGATYYYWIRAINPGGTSSASTSAAGVAVSSFAPSFTLQPTSQLTSLGNSATFLADATGSPNPTFQWRRNGIAIPGATGKSYTVNNATGIDAGNYSVVIANQYGSVVSNTVTLTVNTESSIWLMDGIAFKFGVSLGFRDSNWQLVTAADFNGDNKPDILLQNVVTGERQIQLLDGASQTSTVSLGILDPNWQMVAAADFNGDNKPDIVLQNTITGQRKLWLMNGTTYSSSLDLGTYDLSWHIATAADFDGDGKADLLWQNTVTGQCTIWLMNGTQFIWGVDLGTYDLKWRMAAVADFDGDGKVDIIWQDAVTGQRNLWLMNGTQFVFGVDLGTYDLSWRIVAVADFDHDGKKDILWQKMTLGQVGSAELSTVPSPWSMAGGGDFNADGSTDIVWQNLSTGQRAIWLMNGSDFSYSADLGTVDANWQIAAVADFNRDGSPDLLWQNTTTGQRSIWLMNGTAFGSTVNLGIVDANWRMMAAADINGDLNVDIVWQNIITGQRSAWIMNGASYSYGVDLGSGNPTWRIAAVADFNGDGRPDILLREPTTGQCVLDKMNGTSLISEEPFGSYDQALQCVGAVDFNHSGGPDLLWQNISTGQRFIFFTSGSGY